MIRFSLLPPAIIIVTNIGIPDGFDSYNRGLVILVRPGKENDEGLIVHELAHTAQMFLTFGLHSILYRIWPAYRRYTEVDAYVRQIEHYRETDIGASIDFAVKRLCSCYNLNVRPEEIRKELEEKLEL